MNSALQVLSHTAELTNYFLEEKFVPEINEKNALGTKGKLVRKYHALVKNLWWGTADYHSPYGLKQVIGEVQPMVSILIQNIL
jgi:ubiquitin carboxyl-terminal hydrolase 4/11/15